MANAMKFPPVFADGNAVAVDATDPASTSTCWTSETVAGVVTVNGWPLLDTLPTATTTFPVVAPGGTGTTMLVANQLVGVDGVPLNVTVPFVDPKFAPVIVTAVPTGPLTGERPVILGARLVTLNNRPLLATPPTATTTFPVVAPNGTGTTMLVANQLVGVAGVPLNITVPFVDPKFAPVIVTTVPTGPLAGDKLVIVGIAAPLEVPAALNAATAAPH